MRVVIADDSVLLREGLAHLLADAGFDVVARCGDADELKQAVAALAPDVAIVDIRMPPTHTDEGLRAAIEIRSAHPAVGVLVLSQYVEPALAMTLFADSADGVGYLPKDRVSDVAEFLAAVRRVAAGGAAVDPVIVSSLVSRRRPDDPLARLTPRERAVMELMAMGNSNQGIADRLFITLRAVEKYVSSIFDKLGIPTTARSPAGCSRCCFSCVREKPSSRAGRGRWGPRVSEQHRPEHGRPRAHARDDAGPANAAGAGQRPSRPDPGGPRCRPADEDGARQAHRQQGYRPVPVVTAPYDGAGGTVGAVRQPCVAR